MDATDWQDSYKSYMVERGSFTEEEFSKLLASPSPVLIVLHWLQDLTVSARTRGWALSK